MMKKHTKLFAPLAMALVIGSLTFVFAQASKINPNDSKTGDRQERRVPPPPGNFNPRLLERLNLTDAQKEQIQVIQTNSHDAAKENFDKARGFDEQLKTVVESETFNEDQARQILNNKAQAMTEVEILRLRADAAIFKILTAEQKVQLEQLKQQRPEFPPRGGGFRPEERPQF